MENKRKSLSGPLIGLTTYGRNEENEFMMPAEYVDSVRRAGGVPLLIPPGQTDVAGILSILDGLLLAGGGDLDPALYGGEMHETIYMIDTERDLSELELAKAAIDRGFPTLAICRGLQIVNVALGGTLHEHLPDVVGEEVTHRLPPREPVEHHVKIDPQCRLAKLMGETEVLTASWHHQAIDKIAPALTMTAQAEDGTIEAVELADHPWLIAVQWHPELTSHRDAHQQQIFDGFVDWVCKQKK